MTSGALDKLRGFGETFADLNETARREQTDMAGYKLATYQTPDGPRAGLVIDDKVFDAAKLTGKAGLCDRARHPGGLAGGAGRPQEGGRQAPAKAAPSPAARRAPSCLAPVRWPSAIYCAGANYADHAAEMSRRMNRPPDPDPHTLGLKAWHFIKAPRALADPGATVKISGCLRTGWIGRWSWRR